MEGGDARAERKGDCLQINHARARPTDHSSRGAPRSAADEVRPEEVAMRRTSLCSGLAFPRFALASGSETRTRR
jgi:hypothetical protein